MREIKKTFIYSIKAVFPSKKALLDFIKDKSLINGKYLLEVMLSFFL